MGAAHIAAGVVGAHGLTQHGVDHLNRRKGATSDNNTTNDKTTNVVQNMSAGMNANDEMLIRRQEEEDQAFRDRKPAGRPQSSTGGTQSPVGGPQSKTNTTTKLESTKTRKFFETVSDKK